MQREADEVAAFADANLRVTKRGDNAIARADVEPLSATARVEELARMPGLAGAAAYGQTAAHVSVPGATPARMDVEFATPGFFRVLGAAGRRGRHRPGPPGGHDNFRGRPLRRPTGAAGR